LGGEPETEVMGVASCAGVVLLVARLEEESPLFLFLGRAGGRFDGEWWPVTGTLKPGESPLDGALRELAEETSIIAHAVYDTRLSASDRLGGILPVMVAMAGPQGRVTLNPEHDAYGWWLLPEAQAIVPSVLHHYLAEAERVVRTRPSERQIVP
jgi:8-oxo-dGTP pyrophosphatase MutT (NUDIX family)